jgi:putative transposase
MSLLDSESRLSIIKQCEVMKVSRSKVYDKPKPEIKENDMKLMKLILLIYDELPFYGCRRIRYELRERFDIKISKNRAWRLMKLLGIWAIGPKPNTSKPMKEHKKYAYLLRNLTIDKPNHVWSTDITYIETKFGFCYLVAIVDWYSRAILSYRVSNTMEASFCVDALEEAIARFGVPLIFNTDQGSQFTCNSFIEVLERNKIAISMDGKGRATDNVVIERFWRSIKYEDIFLMQYKTMEEVKNGVAKYMDFYNHRRPHSSLGYRVPMKVYSNFSLPTFITNPGECKINEVRMNQIEKSILRKLA